MNDETTGADSATSPQDSADPAHFPRSLWSSVEYLLHNRGRLMESIRRDEGLDPICQAMLVICVVMATLYGGVMGATNFLQISDMEIKPKLLLIVNSAVRVPILFLLTTAIVFPPIYVSNAFVGSRNTYRQVKAMLLGSVAVGLTVLGSMTSVAFFFALTTRSYHFMRLLHIFIFAYAGLTGLGFFFSCVRQLSKANVRRTPLHVVGVWLLLYIFVGTQLAWTMRPFIGSPKDEIKFFYPREGNFYSAVVESIDGLLTPTS